MSLARRAARGAVWSILGGVGGRAVGLISTLVLTRFIPPRQYGAVSVATVIVHTASSFTGLGLFQYVVATPDVSRKRVFHATVMFLFVGFIALALVVAFRHLFGPWFNAPMAVQFIPGMALASVFERVGFPCERVMIRDLRFAHLSLVRGSTEVVYAITAIGFALAGFGGMSIVYGNMVQWGLFALALISLTRWRDWIEPHRPAWEDTKALLRFGLPMSFAEMAHAAARTWDNLLISRFFGEATCGRYNLAYNLADIPATHVGEQIGEVLLPSLSRLPADGRAWGLVRATRLFAVIIFPLALGLSAVAETATVAIFDLRWKAMAPMLMILASLSIVRPLSWTIGSYLLSQKRPATVAMMEAVKVCGLLGMMALLSRYGVLWACVAVGVAFSFDALLGMIAVRQKDGVPISELGGGVMPTLIACAPMYGAVLGTRYLLNLAGWGPSLLTLAIEIVVGALIYVPSALLLSPTASRDLVQLGKKSLLQRGGDDTDEDEDDGDDGGDDTDDRGTP